MPAGIDGNRPNPIINNKTPEQLYQERQDLAAKLAAEKAAADKAKYDTTARGIEYPYDPNKNLWEQRGVDTYRGDNETNPSNISSYFSNPIPQGLEAFDSARMAGESVVSKIYGSEDAKGMWDRLKSESNQGMDAASMQSVKNKFGSQGVLDQARIQKSGLKGQAAFRASEDLASSRRQEEAAMEATLKKQAFNSLRDEWGRRTLLSTNLPMAYGQLGSAASLGQTIQNLAGTPIVS